jgi:hypothetical protein
MRKRHNKDDGDRPHHVMMMPPSTLNAEPVVKSPSSGSGAPGEGERGHGQHGG